MRIDFSNFRHPAAAARLLITLAAGLTLDLWSKAYAFSHLAPVSSPPSDPRPSSYHLVSGFIHFEITTNRGAVFGLGQGQLILFLVVSVGALGYLLHFFLNRPRDRWFMQILLGILLAGVLGNLYDRLLYGHVRDFIHIFPRWGIFPWIFNVADTLLCIGVPLIVLYFMLEHRIHRPKE